MEEDWLSVPILKVAIHLFKTYDNKFVLGAWVTLLLQYIWVLTSSFVGNLDNYNGLLNV